MFDFYGKRNIFLVISGLVILAGIIGFIVNGGFVYDIQFQGGEEIILSMNDSSYEDSVVANMLSELINKKVHVQSSTTFDVTDKSKEIKQMVIKVATSDQLEKSERTAIVEAVSKEYNVNEDVIPDVNSISASIGNELKVRGILAIVVASLLMLVYIWIRFNVMSGLFAGAIAVLVLIHDVAVMTSLYTIFSIPLNESFIAAVLTIVGYSINDTIVIFDRIRENSKILRKDPLPVLVNKSITQTLSRTINTSVSTLICVVTIYIFATMNGIESIREFTMPLMVGLISGTYSSVFLSSPFWAAWKESETRKKLTGRTA